MDDYELTKREKIEAAIWIVLIVVFVVVAIIIAVGLE